MIVYPREVKEKQKTILDEENKMKVGVFADYFDEFDLLNNKGTFFQRSLNKLSLTEWQAIEVLHEDIFVIAAVFKFGLMNRSLFILYDRNTREVHDYSSVSFIKNKSVVSKVLTGKSKSVRETDHTSLMISNELEKDKLYFKGSSENLNIDIEFKRIANPVVVSLQMTQKHTLYTEKDLLQPAGIIHFNNKEYNLNEEDISILDDHRGYYPLSSGYDWFTCMGELQYEGKNKKFGVNLTSFYKNISKDVSENGFWLDGCFHQLPEVSFERNENIWSINDDQDLVDLTFTVNDSYIEKKNRVLNIDYTLSFGEVSGFVTTATGLKIKISNMFALGEKRITRLPLQSPYQKR
jgi:hypothetical protein